MEVPELEFLWSYVDHWGKEDPEFPAVHYRGKTYTSQELAEITDRLAKVFKPGCGERRSYRDNFTFKPRVPVYIYCC